MAKPLPSAEFDCQTCGLCCVAGHEQDAFCDLTEADLERFITNRGKRWIRRNVLFATAFDLLCQAIDGGRSVGAALRTKIRKVRAGPLKDYEICACFALRGSPLRKVSCSIYEDRPHACRIAVKPGDKVCKTIRRQTKALVS